MVHLAKFLLALVVLSAIMVGYGVFILCEWTLGAWAWLGDLWKETA